jgi:hypothetical protein
MEEGSLTPREWFQTVAGRRWLEARTRRIWEADHIGSYSPLRPLEIDKGAYLGPLDGA